MKKGDRDMAKAPSDTSAAMQEGGDCQLELYDNSPFAENPNYLSKSTHHVYW